jgi:hypothetical protein
MPIPKRSLLRAKPKKYFLQTTRHAMHLLDLGGQHSSVPLGSGQGLSRSQSLQVEPAAPSLPRIISDGFHALFPVTRTYWKHLFR